MMTFDWTISWGDYLASAILLLMTVTVGGYVGWKIGRMQARLSTLEDKMRMAIDSLLLLDDGYSLKTGQYRGYVGGRERNAEVNDGDDDAGDDGEGHADGDGERDHAVLPGLE